MTSAERYTRFLEWKDEHDLTFNEIGRVLSISGQTAHEHLKAETMPTSHHRKLVRLGVPSELLPKPEDKRRGPQPKQARWPGLTPVKAEDTPCRCTAIL